MEVRAGCPTCSSIAPTSCFAALRQSLSKNLELTICARLDVQEVPGAPSVSFPKAEGTNIHSHVQAFYAGAGNTNPSPHVSEKVLPPTGSCVDTGRLVCTLC